jgi:hypothetical protein
MNVVPAVNRIPPALPGLGTEGGPSRNSLSPRGINARLRPAPHN